MEAIKDRKPGLVSGSERSVKKYRIRAAKIAQQAESKLVRYANEPTGRNWNKRASSK